MRLTLIAMYGGTCLGAMMLGAWCFKSWTGIAAGLVIGAVICVGDYFTTERRRA